MTPHLLLRSISFTIAAGLAVLISLGAAPAASAAPQMSVTITDGVKTVKSGTSLTYTTEVKNMGADPVAAKVVLTVPSYVTVDKAGDGTVEKNTTTWNLTVAPHETGKLQLAAKVGAIPKTEVRVTAVASVFIDGVKPSPLIRTADANHIQGVADTPAAKPAASSTTPHSWNLGWTIAIVVAAVLILAAVIATVVLVRRRRAPIRRRQTQP